PKILASVLKRRSPLVMSEITGIESPTGARAHGFFVAVPFLSWQFLELEEDYVIEKISKACKLAKKIGAKIVGLGAFTAIPGGGGRMLANLVDIPITTGNTYTTALAIEGSKQAAQFMDIKLENAKVAVVGATGSIGRACAQILAPEVGNLVLVGRDQLRLEQVQEKIKKASSVTTDVSCNIRESLRESDLVITVTGSTDSIIYPDDLKPGSIVCDVARPRDVSKLVTEARNDVLVIDGAIVNTPGDVNFNLDYGPPPTMAEGCVAETIILTLERRYENYTIGKNITVEMVKEMGELGKKHGFSIAGLRRHEKLLSEQQIQKVKRNAAKVLKLGYKSSVG
ncbi:hypothetical protein LCGC14_2699300, partial [marine sediment metagenome]